MENEIKLVSIATGFWKAQILQTIINLDIHLKIPRNDSVSAFELGKEINVDPECLFRTMRASSALGIFREEVSKYGHFSHNDVSQLLLDPNGIITLLRFHGHKKTSEMWFNFEETVRTGKPMGPKQLGLDNFWGLINGCSEYKYHFEVSLASHTHEMVSKIMENTDFSMYDKVVDLGGSLGVFVQEILAGTPSLKQGINFDIPQVIESNKKRDLSHLPPKVLSRYSEVGGSFFEDIPPSDCYVIKLVLHNWSDQHCKQILENVGKHMLPNGKILIFERILNTSNQNIHPVLLDLHMMHLIGGKERLMNEWYNLAEASGFNIDSILMLDNSNGRITLSKKN
eukprot:gene7773-9571_t